MTYSIIRVRFYGGDELGWYDSKSHAIRMDSDMGLSLLAHWRVNSKEDQEDYGVPSAGYRTAFGYWVIAEDAA